MTENTNEQSPPPLPSTAASNSPALPEVELPRVGRILSDFAREVGAVMRQNGVYLQGGRPIVLDRSTGRMIDLTPACFRTYAEKSLRTVKLVKLPWKKEDGSDAYEARADSMNKMQAEAVLVSPMFLEQLPQLRRISRVPVPILRDGELTLHCTGYDAATKILVEEA